VRVRASHDKATLTVSIADTGVGIPPEEVEKLGRPFEQVETQLTKSHRGSGLGLAISRSLVELHGGRLSIESELGVGTTVAFTIPFEPATTSEPAAA
jgi:two-component system cell cycle sensor histidine kinase PleC